MLRELSTAVAAGTLRARVDATYPLTEVRQAVAHAARLGRNGKVLVTGPG